MSEQFSRAQIRNIAAATKRVCQLDGRGPVVCVFDSGDWKEADPLVLRLTRASRSKFFTIFRYPARESDVTAAIRDELHFRRMVAERRQA